MAAKPTVVKSVNNADGSRCVDVFRRADGSYGFEEYRRDAEDARGWFPVGGYGGSTWRSEADAWRAAVAAIPWVADT